MKGYLRLLGRSVLSSSRTLSEVSSSSDSSVSAGWGDGPSISWFRMTRRFLSATSAARSTSSSLYGLNPIHTNISVLPSTTRTTTGAVNVTIICISPRFGNSRNGCKPGGTVRISGRWNVLPVSGRRISRQKKGIRLL